MKKLKLPITLLSLSLALAACESTRTTSRTSQVGPYTSDRFDNRDQRSNSLSTPAYPGADQSSLGPDITSSDYPESTPLSGTSSPSAATPGATTPPPTGTEAQAQQTETQATTTTKKKVKRIKKSGAAPSAGVSAPSTEESASQTLEKSGSTSTSESSQQSASGTSTTTEEDSDLSAETTGTESDKELSGSGTESAGPTTQVPIHTYEKDKPVSGSSEESMDQMQTRKSGTATAQDTDRSRQATELVSQIRSELMSNKNLSANAHNVKIISQNGQILLKGPVADANEKLKVEEIAKRVAGNTMVINQMTITARSGTSTDSDSNSEKTNQ